MSRFMIFFFLKKNSENLVATTSIYDKFVSNKKTGPKHYQQDFMTWKILIARNKLQIKTYLDLTLQEEL